LNNSDRNEFEKLLRYVTSVVKGSEWVASFGNTDICVVSTTPVLVNSEKVFKKVLNESINDFVPSNVPAKIEENTTLFSAGFQYKALGDKGYVSEFVTKFKAHRELKLTSSISLEFTYAWIRACTVTY